MPNLATVIPAMDYIEQVMTGYKRNATYDPAIWTAIGFGKTTLNKYYSLTDSSEVYRIAMSKLMHNQEVIY